MPVCLLKGSLVDVETTGLPSDSSAEPITVGYIVGDTLQIIQRTFKDSPLQLLKRIPRLPEPLCAFNRKFEEYFLKVKVEEEVQATPYERKRDAIRIEGLQDPFYGEGRRVVEVWKAHLRSRELSHVESIMQHNLSCLISELCLLTVRKTSLNITEKEVGDRP